MFNVFVGGFRNFFNDAIAGKFINWVFWEIPNTSSRAGPSRWNRKMVLADILDSDDTDEEAVFPSIPSRLFQVQPEKS